ncbi:MAG: 30S ribosomal protein S6 [Actinomycetota bacterium]
MRKYELMIILPPESDEARVGAVLERVTQALADQGKVGNVDRWGKRRLAYQLGENSDGYYLLVEFDAEPDAISELQRTLTLADDVVRHKVVVRAA